MAAIQKQQTYIARNGRFNNNFRFQMIVGDKLGLKRIYLFGNACWLSNVVQAYMTCQMSALIVRA